MIPLERYLKASIRGLRAINATTKEDAEFVAYVIVGFMCADGYGPDDIAKVYGYVKEHWEEFMEDTEDTDT